MSDLMVVADSNANYNTDEGAVIVAALVWLFAIGSSVVAAWILCGWRGAKQVTIDWWHMKATFWCR